MNWLAKNGIWSVSAPECARLTFGFSERCVRRTLKYVRVAAGVLDRRAVAQIWEFRLSARWAGLLGGMLRMYEPLEGVCVDLFVKSLV